MTPSGRSGRPTKYSPELAERICEQIALGKSLRAVCASKAMPARQTVFRWLAVHWEFRDRYARARELQADTFADEIVQIADEATDANRARLQIDARKWAAAKQRPSKYSDRTVNELTGKDGKPVEVTHTLDEAGLAMIKRFLGDDDDK